MMSCDLCSRDVTERTVVRVSHPEGLAVPFLLCGYCLMRRMADGAIAAHLRIDMSGGAFITVIRAAMAVAA